VYLDDWGGTHTPSVAIVDGARENQGRNAAMEYTELSMPSSATTSGGTAGVGHTDRLRVPTTWWKSALRGAEHVFGDCLRVIPTPPTPPQ
jgi:hypothetical protein